MIYDPSSPPDPEQWLASDESERLDAMQAWATEFYGESDDDRILTVVPLLVVENQLASGEPAEARATMERLHSAGIPRFLALLAMADVVSVVTEAAFGGEEGTDLEADLVAGYAAIDPDNLSGLDDDDVTGPYGTEEESLEDFEQRMFASVPAFDERQRRILDDFADKTDDKTADKSAQEHAGKGAMGFAESAGFFFGIHACPDLVKPSEWSEMVQRDAMFEDEHEARTVLEARMALYNWVAQAFPSDAPALPAECRPSPGPMDDVDNDTEFSKWCRGAVIAHGWLEESWDEAVRTGSENEKDISAALLLLSFFASRELAESALKELDLDPESIDSVARTFRFDLLDRIQAYQEIGLMLRRFGAPPDRTPARSEKTGRNEPCPCGSGKKFKKCCGGPHSVH